MASNQLDQQKIRKMYMLCYRDMFSVQINNGKMKDNALQNEVELHAQVRKPKSLPSKPN